MRYIRWAEHRLLQQWLMGQILSKVDKIAGPGNIYVTLAKKLVYGTVGIDSLAGPSDITIIADDECKAGFYCS